MRFTGLDNVLEEKLKKILKGIDTRKRIFVWGYREGGEIICDLLEQRGFGGVAIIDSACENNEREIKKPDCLREVSPNHTIIFLCMKNWQAKEIKDALEARGFKKNFDYFPIVEQVYGDSNHALSRGCWIEYRYGADIFEGKNNRDGECAEYTPTPWESLQRIADAINIRKGDALFDYGMGKGGVIVWLSLKNLFQNLAGVEREEDLYRIACENFKKLAIENVTAICSDAREITNELDAYNYFFFYNPFSGAVFASVLLNIINSYKRKMRTIRIIYINTVCHDMIMASGIFKLEKQVAVNHFIPLANIYTTETAER